MVRVLREDATNTVLIFNSVISEIMQNIRRATNNTHEDLTRIVNPYSETSVFLHVGTICKFAVQMNINDTRQHFCSFDYRHHNHMPSERETRSRPPKLPKHLAEMNLDMFVSPFNIR